jgi:hypothetical protein
MNQIILFKSLGSWMAWFKGPHAHEVKRLFGSDVIPTAFRAGAEDWQVLKTIGLNNPGIEVTVK